MTAANLECALFYIPTPLPSAPRHRHQVRGDRAEHRGGEPLFPATDTPVLDQPVTDLTEEEEGAHQADRGARQVEDQPQQGELGRHQDRANYRVDMCS